MDDNERSRHEPNYANQIPIPSNKPPPQINLKFSDFSNPLKDPVPPQLKHPQPSSFMNQGGDHMDASAQAMPDANFRRVNRTASNFYIPGVTPGQPYKVSQYRYCYNITKKAGKQANQFGDKFDYFLYTADKKINYYESKIIDHNPYNPFKLEVEFKVNVVEDGQYDEFKGMLKQKYGITADNILAIEGCINDDKTILGGKNEFFSHFCTFFNFNICYSNKENKAMKKTFDLLSDHDALNKKVDDFMKSFDDIK